MGLKYRSKHRTTYKTLLVSKSNEVHLIRCIPQICRSHLIRNKRNNRGCHRDKRITSEKTLRLLILLTNRLRCWLKFKQSLLVQEKELMPLAKKNKRKLKSHQRISWTKMKKESKCPDDQAVKARALLFFLSMPILHQSLAPHPKPLPPSIPQINHNNTRNTTAKSWPRIPNTDLARSNWKIFMALKCDVTTKSIKIKALTTAETAAIWSQNLQSILKTHSRSIPPPSLFCPTTVKEWCKMRLSDKCRNNRTTTSKWMTTKFKSWANRRESRKSKSSPWSKSGSRRALSKFKSTVKLLWRHRVTTSMMEKMVSRNST